MLKWQHLFPKQILARGREYFRAGRVLSIEERSGSYRATVLGEEKYTVSIMYINETIIHSSCSCPYAEGGNNCKHMAAALYAIANSQLPEKLRETPVHKAIEEEDRIKITPFQPSEEQKNSYRYFKFERVCSQFEIYSNTFAKAKELLACGDLSGFHIRTGYSDYGEQLYAEAGINSTAFSRSAASIMFSGEKAMSIDCRYPGCSKSYWGISTIGQRHIEPCEHQLALLISVDDYLKKNNIGDCTDRRSQRMLDSFESMLLDLVPMKNTVTDAASENAFINSRTVVLEPKLDYYCGRLIAGFRIGTAAKMYIAKNLPQIVEAVDGRGMLSLGSKLTLDFSRDRFDGKSEAYYTLINRYVRDEQGRPYGFSSAYTRKDPRQEIPLSGSLLDEFFDLSEGLYIQANEDMCFDGRSMIFIEKGEPRLSLELDSSVENGEFRGVTLTGTLPETFNGAKYKYCLSDGSLLRMEGSRLEKLRPLMDQAGMNGYIDFEIGRQNLPSFYHNILPVIRSCAEIIDNSSFDYSDYIPPAAELFFYLDSVNGIPSCRAEAQYGDERKYSLISDNNTAVTPAGLRDRMKETLAIQTVEKYFPYKDLYSLHYECAGDEDSVFRAITDGVDAMCRIGSVMSTPAFDALKVHRRPSIKLGVSLESDILNLQISSDALSQQELLDLLGSYKLKKKYHRLKNGEFISIDDSVRELSEMVDTLRLSPKEFIQGNIHLPAYRALYMDRMLEQSTALHSSKDSRFRKLIKDFRTIDESELEIPPSLQGTLRPYQEHGFKWLRTLEEYGFGGILADDMGLGKTLQMISVILSAKESGKTGTSLIICPASLVYNWANEFSRFAPALSVCTVTGTQKERAEVIEHYAKWDVLITSYDLLRRDCPLYEDAVFLYQILDEAQYIKNHTTAASKAVKIIISKYRFALTGTPVENRLSELWSIFDYLMPGILYSYEIFRRDYETPIVKKSDEAASSNLRRVVSLFILRRLKTDVLNDLPDKVEETRVVRFASDQQQLYNAQVAHMKELLASADKESIGKSKIRLLAELTKIRQICCDPSLLFEDYSGESAKREACLDLLRSAIESGHKVLLFSQFTSMLALLKEDLDRENISYYELTGSTPKKERLDMVNRFNDNDVPVFLISLKAGGTGLNLTGADVVIHYDPWWNAAAQNQATDRAHRIGQTRSVTVYKLIVSGSIEEKIQKMQEMKMQLADEIISGDTTSIGSLSRDELLDLIS